MQKFDGIDLDAAGKVAGNGFYYLMGDIARLHSALLSYAIDKGYDDAKKDIDKVEEISGFDSEKKCATVKLKNGDIYWKGATENIINRN